MSTYSRPRPPADRSRHHVERAEAALIGHYARLVRLAYLTLPPALGRHRRVLAAHGTVQRSLRGVRRGRREPALPAQRGESSSDYAWVRLRVLRGALAEGTRTGWWPPRLSARHALPLRLPAVLGLRLFPRAGGAGELALDQALSEVRPEVRAAFALLLLDGLPSEAVRAELAQADGRDPGGAVRAAERLRSAHEDAGALLRSEEFDPCTVHTRPTDLIRRRRRARFAAMTGALAVLTCTALAVTSGPPDQGRTAAPVAGPGSAVVDPARLVRAGHGGWADSARVDFTVWPSPGFPGRGPRAARPGAGRLGVARRGRDRVRGVRHHRRTAVGARAAPVRGRGRRRRGGAAARRAAARPLHRAGAGRWRPGTGSRAGGRRRCDVGRGRGPHPGRRVRPVSDGTVDRDGRDP
nr:hypothetical protein [Streptomyces uncialis]